MDHMKKLANLDRMSYLMKSKLELVVKKAEKTMYFYFFDRYLSQFFGLD